MTAPEQLVTAFLDTIENKIVPLTQKGVSSGSKVFGAAIYKKENLELVWATTNNEADSPLLHGEINCIQEFFSKIPKDQRPNPADCIFLSTHEPCSLCLSGITWSGFNEFYYLFTYEDSRDRFAIPYDIQILEEVFRVKGPSDTDESVKQRELYNRKNKFFNADSLAGLVSQVKDNAEKERLGKECERVKTLYDGLSETYQSGKSKGVESASVWK